MTAYAERRGVSRQAVSLAVQTGRISVTTDDKGFRWIDPDQADKDWDANTDHAKRRNTADTANGSASGPAGRPSAQPSPAAPQTVSAQSSHDDIDLDPDVDGAEEQDSTYAAARARKEHYAAEMARLKLEEMAGTLVSADDVAHKWNNIATLVRNKVLSIPSKCRQRMPELTDDQFFAIEAIVRDQLEDLTNGNG